MNNLNKQIWTLFSIVLVMGLVGINLLPTAYGQNTAGDGTAPTIAENDITPITQPVTGDDETQTAADETNAETAIPTKNLLQVIRDGGVLMLPIAVCSFILCVFVFERAISLRRGRVIPKPFVERFIEQLAAGEIDRDEGLQLCEENRSPVAEVFAAAVKKWGRPAVEVEQAVIDEGERVTNGLRAYLRLFNGIATISPLLGLLGTVLGMIRAFNSIATADAMGRPELLASGISQALLTTAAGLSVAIPALIAYLYFSSRVDVRIMDIDAASQRVVNQVSAEALSVNDSRSSNRKSKAA